MPKPQTDIEQKTDVDELALSKLQIGQSDLKEEQVDSTDSLIPPTTTKAPNEIVEKNDSDALSEAEKSTKQEEEKCVVCQRTYVGQLSEEEESITELDYSGYSYFS